MDIESTGKKFMVLKILTSPFFLDSITGHLWKNDPLSYLKAGPLFSQKLQNATGHLKRKEKTECVFKPLINKFSMQKHRNVLVRWKIQVVQKYLKRNLGPLPCIFVCYIHPSRVAREQRNCPCECNCRIESF